SNQCEDRLLRDRASDGEQSQCGGRGSLGALTPGEDAPAVVAIRDVPYDEHQCNGRQKLCEAYKAEVEHTAGECVPLPSVCNRLHLVGEDRGKPSDPVLPEGSMLEDGRGV